MATPKKTTAKKQPKTPIITEQRLLIILICVLLICIGVLLVKNNQNANIIDATSTEQKAE